MCRRIKTLRRSEGLAAEQEIYEAALQFVRKVCGYCVPSQVNQAVFEESVREMLATSSELLDSLKGRSLEYVTLSLPSRPSPLVRRKAEMFSSQTKSRRECYLPSNKGKN